jgi:hypothetical protein
LAKIRIGIEPVHFLANFYPFLLTFAGKSGDFWPKFAGGEAGSGGVVSTEGYGKGWRKYKATEQSNVATFRFINFINLFFRLVREANGEFRDFPDLLFFSAIYLFGKLFPAPIPSLLAYIPPHPVSHKNLTLICRPKNSQRAVT